MKNPWLGPAHPSFAQTPSTPHLLVYTAGQATEESENCIQNCRSAIFAWHIITNTTTCLVPRALFLASKVPNRDGWWDGCGLTCPPWLGLFECGTLAADWSEGVACTCPPWWQKSLGPHSNANKTGNFLMLGNESHRFTQMHFFFHLLSSILSFSNSTLGWSRGPHHAPRPPDLHP